SGVYVLFGNGNGTFGPPQHVARQQVVVAAADLTGNGRSDIIAGGLTYEFYVMLGESNRTFGAPIPYSLPFEPNGAPFTVGDLNGDGKPDLVIPCQYCGQLFSSVVVLLGNGDGTFSPAPNQCGTMPGLCDATWLSPFAVAIADINGDGIPDLALTLNQNFDVQILLGKGDGTFSEAGRFGTGAAPLYVVAGHFHDRSDGKADLAVGAAGVVSLLINTTQ
ncbi:MAG TPA: VCBS repeat-containing protein, partial [Terriglobales bacterium]|nr:VCBS repeat-containing protein [Terriglobales bacterium]